MVLVDRVHIGLKQVKCAVLVDNNELTCDQVCWLQPFDEVDPFALGYWQLRLVVLINLAFTHQVGVEHVDVALAAAHDALQLRFHILTQHHRKIVRCWGLIDF
jgi:hypothetical protein